VDDDGLADLGGDLHLSVEGLMLDGDIGVFEVVVVEADLPDGDAAGVGGEAAELGEGLGGSVVGLLGVDSGAGVDLRLMVAGDAVGQIEREVHLGWILTDADGENGLYARLPGAAEDLVAVGGVRGVKVEMCVRIDEHRCFDLGPHPP